MHYDYDICILCTFGSKCRSCNNLCSLATAGKWPAT